MRNKREAMLLAVFLAALFCAVAVISWRVFNRSLDNQKALLKQKIQALEEANNWIAEKDQWTAKGKWLEDHPPPPYEGAQTDAAFIDGVQASLARNGVEIIEQRPQEAQMGNRMVEVGINLVLSAPLEKLVRWLHDTQKTDAFRIISRIRLKSDADDSKIRAEVSLVQLYGKAPARSASVQ